MVCYEGTRDGGGLVEGGRLGNSSAAPVGGKKRMTCFMPPVPHYQIRHVDPLRSQIGDSSLSSPPLFPTDLL